MASDDKPVRVSRGFVDAIPHNKALGIKVVSFQRAEAIFELPYDEKLIGNPDTGDLTGIDDTPLAAISALPTRADVLQATTQSLLRQALDSALARIP